MDKIVKGEIFGALIVIGLIGFIFAGITGAIKCIVGTGLIYFVLSSYYKNS
jgi:hypothetical protein